MVDEGARRRLPAIRDRVLREYRSSSNDERCTDGCHGFEHSSGGAHEFDLGDCVADPGVHGTMCSDSGLPTAASSHAESNKRSAFKGARGNFIARLDGIARSARRPGPIPDMGAKSRIRLMTGRPPSDQK